MAEEETENEGYELPKEIYEELDKISKLDVSIEQFNKMAKEVNLSEEKKNDAVLKKDKKKEISTILSAPEKKRYENLGKAFMAGANDVIQDIQQAINKKAENSLDGKENIESKIKGAEKKLEEVKNKKSSTLKKILIAGAALGGLVLVFSTINGSISNMYEKIKNGIMGFGDFIKKSASSIFTFFGNMFIKASESLNNGGALTSIMAGIVWDFFTYTLPKMVISLVEELIQIFDDSYKSTSHDKIEKRDNQLTVKTESAKKDSEGLAAGFMDDVTKFFLSQEKEILKQSKLSAKEQEEVADNSYHILQSGFDAFAKRNEDQAFKFGEEIATWSLNFSRLISNNQISTTGFYETATNILTSMDRRIPNIMELSLNNLTDAHVNFIQNFAKDWGVVLGMSQEEILAYEKLNDEEKLSFVKNLRDTMQKFKDDIDKNLKDANKNKSSSTSSNEGSMASILKSIKEDVRDKDAHLHIIKFQEVTAIGNLHETIKTFINDTRFTDSVRKLGEILVEKFDIILDSANAGLGSLTRAIANEFTLVADGEQVSVGGEIERSNNAGTILGVPDDFKILYIFNNTASTNDDNVTNKMKDFLDYTEKTTALASLEIKLLTDLEEVSQSLMNGILYYSDVVNNGFEKTNQGLTEHLATLVSAKDQSDASGHGIDASIQNLLTNNQLAVAAVTIQHGGEQYVS